MNNPIAKAKWVLETKEITGIPVESLHNIASSEGIHFLYRSLPNDPKLGGQLLYKGEQKGIIINTFINHKGRHNFTFAHELGHYFLEHPPSYKLDGQYGFWCSTDDIGDGKRPREVEANRFAVELLMPEEDFRLDMAGAPIDFDLFRGLSDKYMVSKHASSNRVLDLTLASCIVIVTNGSRINGYKASRAARGFLRQSSTIPDGTAALDAVIRKKGQEDFCECLADKWLIRSVPGQKIYECTRGSFGNEVAMTILKW